MSKALKDLAEPSRRPGAGGPPRRGPEGDAASWRHVRWKRLVLWGVAGLWPAALLATGYFALRGVLAGQPAALATAAEERVADLQKRLDAADVRQQQLEKSEEQLKGKLGAAAKDLADARKQLKDAELARAPVPPPVDPREDPRHAPPAGSPLIQIGEAHYCLPGYEILLKGPLGRPEPPREPYRAKLDRPGAVLMEMRPPGATSPSPFQVKPGSQGKLIRVELARPAGADGRPVVPMLVLEMALEGDLLRWEWLFTKADLSEPVTGPYGKSVGEAVTEIGKLLRYSVCVLSDDKGQPVQQVQFIAPEGPKKVSTDGNQSTKLDAPGDPCNPTWADASVGDWKAEVKGGVLSMTHQKSQAGVRLKLQNDRGTVRLSAEWPKDSDPAEIQKDTDALETKIRAAEKALAGADREVAKSSGDLKPLQEKMDSWDKEVQKLKDDLGITALEKELNDLDAKLKQVDKELPRKGGQVDTRHPTYEEKCKEANRVWNEIYKLRIVKEDREKQPELVKKNSGRDKFKTGTYAAAKTRLDDATKEQKGQQDALKANQEKLAAARVRLADTGEIGKMQFRVVAKGSGAILALVEVEVPKAGGQP